VIVVMMIVAMLMVVVVILDSSFWYLQTVELATCHGKVLEMYLDPSSPNRHQRNREAA
jgi:hypothetical protein